MQSITMKNIACNLIYNNGDEGIYVGFNGRCDIKNILINTKPGNGRWCSQPDCSCQQFKDRGFKGPVKDYPCNESALFRNWTWNAGARFETKEPFLIKKSGKKKVAILTTRFPGTLESERKIIGLFQIKEIIDEHQVISYQKHRIRMTLDEAKELNFWSYYRNEGKGDVKKSSTSAQWSSGRFRYLSDEQVAAVLHDLQKVLQEDSSRSSVRELLENDFAEYALARPKVQGILSEDPVQKVRLQRKYGKGGESHAHKQLKNYVANNPNQIGLKKRDVIPTVEHSYISGDMVDILFAPKKDGDHTVVEIELDNVLPGIHQAIKYRALRCSQLGISLNSKKVKATVVAWQFTPEEEKLCKRYGIDHYAIRL